MGIKKVELLDLEYTLDNAQLPSQIEEITENEESWTRSPKEARDPLRKDLQLERTDVFIKNLKPEYFTGVDLSFRDNNGLLIGFDESQYTKAGTYARVTCFKFGESQVDFENSKFREKNYIYQPVYGYIEDSSQKINVYTQAVENFVSNLEEEFKDTSLRPYVERIRIWRNNRFPRSTKIEWRRFLPTAGHVADRIRTLDELLCSVIRMRQIKEEFTDRELIFLGDGISAFRPHIIPPASFTIFFTKFLQHYKIKYYAVSKTCRLRESESGVFILPVISSIIGERPFIVRIPQTHSRSNTHLVRLITSEIPALRFDVPMNVNFSDTISIIKKIIPFCPLGYPLCLKNAHNSSLMSKFEKRILEVKYLEVQEDPRTKNLIQELREFFV